MSRVHVRVDHVLKTRFSGLLGVAVVRGGKTLYADFSCPASSSGRFPSIFLIVLFAERDVLISVTLLMYWRAYFHLWPATIYFSNAMSVRPRVDGCYALVSLKDFKHGRAEKR